MKKRQYRSNQGRSPYQEEQSMKIIGVLLLVAWTCGIILLTIKLI
jgi:hypothetical protein